MKLKFYIILFAILCMGQSSFTQVIRAFTPRYTNSSVKGNVVYVANSIISTTGIGAGNPGTGEPPPGGSSINNVATAIDIDVDASTVSKLAFGSIWNYYAAGGAPANDGGGNTWKVPAYVLPLGWNIGGVGTGAGKYGFNAAPQNTCLPSGQLPICTPAAGNKYTAYYFRQNVNFTAAELTTTFNYIQLNVKRDDGIVIYINGVERARDNMPAGVPLYGTTATANIAVGATENFTFNLSRSFFIAGANTIAVEVHTAAANSIDMSFDMEVLGIPNFNSSTADLSLPSCSNVLFAGLYWGAGEGSNAGNTAWISNETTCSFKIPGASSFINMTSTQTDYWNPTLIAGYAHTGYNCFQDITSLINTSSPNGTYTVANVASPVGKTDAYGGWTIVIVYANPSEQTRNLSVFDGNAIVKSGSGNVDVAISGFLTPPTGPVSCELGTVVYDGDRTSTDGFQFKQNGAAGFYDMATTTIPLNGAADAWNSKISTKGVVNAGRNPAFQNTLGYDASIFDLPNASNTQLSNSQSSATVRFFSNSENVITNVLTTAISQYTPSFAFDKIATDINGGTLLPGDSLLYTINFQNLGNDSSTNSTILDNIPFGTTYLPNSLKISGVAKTDVATDDQAEFQFINNRVVFRIGVGANAITGGNIGNGVSGTVEFKVVLPSSCTVISCAGVIRNRARINYFGKTSGTGLFDSSGVNSSGCIVPGPVVRNIAGTCYNPGDTILTNTCPAIKVNIPFRKYGGYTFYSAQPFIPANIYDPTIPVISTHVYWAYFNSGAGCSDTIKVSVFIITCPDIDDDNDGIPDYVELDNPVALQDANGNGIPNWNDPTYPGYIDNNSDGFNDNFDPSADSDNDGIPNFYDINFPGFVDSNADGVNDNMDKDLDGIPNHLDLDSDNDGIPDTVESFGVDANGDGRIDNYSDTDNDGFSQNVDANNTGVAGSGVGLGALDTDGDGIPNYLDLDSDNDGIPDIIEVYGTDSGNSAKVASYSDADTDGYSDNLDADVGNDNVVDNPTGPLLKTGTDGNNDGRCDSWPNKNMDTDSKPNPYDMDSDGDGITDVKEAQFTDADWNGRVDGAVNANGRNTALAGLGSLTLPNTDGVGKVNPYDIDSDEDGIPDNVEGMTTAGYLLPANADTDGDGIDNSYDNFNGFGGDGIHVVNTDGDAQPDYLDNDTDSDGLIDRIEGNDFNFNGLPDDNVTLTGVDTDGDGLDDRFDANNSSAEATSARMGNGGSISGDPTPGSTTPVQHTALAGTLGCPTERDWRCVSYVLSCEIISFKASIQNDHTKLNWTVLCEQEIEQFVVQRSIDGINFSDVITVAGRAVVNVAESYTTTDDVSIVPAEMLYYRLRIISRSGKTRLSDIVAIRHSRESTTDVQLLPNPVRSQLQLLISSTSSLIADVYIMDENGRVVQKYKENVQQGNNTFTYSQVRRLPVGLYYLRLNIGNEIITKKFSVVK